MKAKSEEKLQQECFVWHWNTYPDRRDFLYHNFNNPPNAIQGAKLKTLGLIRGVADMTLLHGGKVYFIELKTFEGRQSQRQKDWELSVTREGFPYLVIRSLESFKELIYKIYADRN